MTMAEKLARLIEDSGWSIAEVTRRIGRKSNQPLLRWLGKAGTGRKPKGASPNKDGSEPKARESAPTRGDLIEISDLFGVDIRWLIDDEMEWEDQLKIDNPILTRIRRVTMDEQLAMWTWFSQQGAGEAEGESGSTSHPKLRNTTKSPRRGRGDDGRDRKMAE